MYTVQFYKYELISYNLIGDLVSLCACFIMFWRLWHIRTISFFKYEDFRATVLPIRDIIWKQFERQHRSQKTFDRRPKCRVTRARPHCHHTRTVRLKARLALRTFRGWPRSRGPVRVEGRRIQADSCRSVPSGCKLPLYVCDESGQFGSHWEWRLRRTVDRSVMPASVSGLLTLWSESRFLYRTWSKYRAVLCLPFQSAPDEFPANLIQTRPIEADVLAPRPVCKAFSDNNWTLSELGTTASLLCVSPAEFPLRSDPTNATDH